MSTEKKKSAIERVKDVENRSPARVAGKSFSTAPDNRPGVLKEKAQNQQQQNRTQQTQQTQQQNKNKDKDKFGSRT